MRAAPAVLAVSQGSSAWCWGQAACHALAAAGLVAWACGWLEVEPARSAAAALIGGLIAVPLSERLWRPRLVPFGWDGDAWSVDIGAGEALRGKLEPVLDLGGWMLLRFTSDAGRGGIVWLPVSARATPAWPALRAAVYADAAAASAGPAEGATPTA